MAKTAKRKKPFKICTLDSVRKEHTALSRYGGKFVFAFEDNYPLALSAIPDAPPVISVMGDVSMLSRQGIALVGARNASLNGRKFAEKLARELGEAEQIVTSGLARGIDTAAHNGALSTGTIAVVAGGIDVVYPEENQSLYDQICKKGCVVAESPFGQVPYAQSFPKRNRIISGLSAALVVVEATMRSGSLISARMAAEQGRDVFAVPGFPLDPRSQGPNKLIQDGAILVQRAEDVLNALNSFTRSAPRSFNDMPQQEFTTTYEDDPVVIADAESAILSQLTTVPVQADDLLRATGIDNPAFASAILELEISGRVQRHPGNRISRIDIGN